MDKIKKSKTKKSTYEKIPLEYMYKTNAYSSYHNVLIEIKSIISTSMTAQEKVNIILQEVCAAHEEVRVNNFKLENSIKARQKA